MFICQHTGEVIPAGIKMNKVVVEKRERTYQRPIKRYGKVVDWEDVKGWEIVKELCVGPDGYRILTGLEPANIGSAATSPTAKRVESNSRPYEPWRNRNNNRNNDRRDNRPQRGGRAPVVEVVQRYR